eukprot:3130107-Pleurochrysis_carterae.AAC.1
MHGVRRFAEENARTNQSRPRGDRAKIFADRRGELEFSPCSGIWGTLSGSTTEGDAGESGAPDAFCCIMRKDSSRVRGVIA